MMILERTDREVRDPTYISSEAMKARLGCLTQSALGNIILLWSAEVQRYRRGLSKAKTLFSTRSGLVPRIDKATCMPQKAALGRKGGIN